MKKLIIGKALVLSCLLGMFMLTVAFTSAETAGVSNVASVEVVDDAAASGPCTARIRVTTANIPSGANWGVTVFQNGVQIAQFTTTGRFTVTLEDDANISICADASDIDVPHSINVVYDVANGPSGSFSYPTQTCATFVSDCC
ncbi:MAG: hypothetical protein AAFV95_21040 [Bacteroidota bacterium]